MNQNLTEIAVVLDRSGSMSACREEARNGFNSFLDSQQKAPGQCKLTLVLFDHEYIVAANGIPIAEFHPLDDTTYVPRGMTALLDAVGRTIATVGERLDNTAEDQRPGKIMVVILTDGFENASKEFSADQVRKLIQQQRSIYSWEFIYLGASLDGIKEVVQVAAVIGIPAQNVANMAMNAQGQQVNSGEAVSNAMQGVQMTTSAYRASAPGDQGYTRHLATAGQWGGGLSPDGPSAGLEPAQAKPIPDDLPPSWRPQSQILPKIVVKPGEEPKPKKKDYTHAD
jgi:uncharacterized protein YegL